MTIQVSRLKRLLPSLTLEQRFDAVLAAYRNEELPDWALMQTIPREHEGQWNRMTGLLNATHVQLGWYTEVVEATVTQLELRFGILLGLQYAGLLLDERLFELALDPEGEEKRVKVRSKQERLEQMTGPLAVLIGEELKGRWLDVRLAQFGADSLARECLGRDILHPDTSAMLAECEVRLRSLKEKLDLWVECEFEDPTDEQIQRLLDLLEKQAEG